MVSEPKRPCRHPGCSVLLSGGGLCDRHRKRRQRQQDQRRGSAASRLYGAAWRKARALFLSENPWCVHCLARGSNFKVVATVVDHIVPHRGDLKLFWDQENWQALCKPCHDIKTATEDGGFGHPPDPVP